MRDAVFAVVVGLLIFLLLGAALYGYTRTKNEGDAGTVWCYENGGEVVGYEGASQPLCFKDGKMLKLPEDKDGLWP